MTTCAFCGIEIEADDPTTSANMPEYQERRRLLALEDSLARSQREGLGFAAFLTGGTSVCPLCRVYLGELPDDAGPQALQEALQVQIDLLRQRLTIEDETRAPPLGDAL
jgi:hypothetical protein